MITLSSSTSFDIIYFRDCGLTACCADGGHAVFIVFRYNTGHCSFSLHCHFSPTDLPLVSFCSAFGHSSPPLPFSPAPLLSLPPAAFPRPTHRGPGFPVLPTVFFLLSLLLPPISVPSSFDRSGPILHPAPGHTTPPQLRVGRLPTKYLLLSTVLSWRAVFPIPNPFTFLLWHFGA